MARPIFCAAPWAKKKAKELDSMKQKFIDSAKQNHGIDEETSTQIFALLQHFAGYGFNKSHSAAYALVATRRRI